LVGAVPDGLLYAAGAKKSISNWLMRSGLS
jgi:hypothetical protein